MKTNLTTAERAEAIRWCEKQVVEMVLGHHFFASLLLGLKRSYDDSVPTMCTDGECLKIGPAFVHGIEDEEIRGVLIHEVLHCALGHPWRRGDREPRKFNYAADYAINLLIDDYIKAGNPVALPQGCLLDQQYRDLSTEAIYARLPDPPQGGGGAPGTGDDIMEGANPTDPATGKPKSNEEMASEWKGRMVQAAQAARMQGNLPGCIERFVGEMIEPKVPWRQVLRRFLTDTVKSDYDWMKPDRRFMPMDIYIPDIGDEEAAGEIVVAIDTSGSIGNDMLNAFTAELNSIHKDLKPSKVHVVYCDAAVAHVDEFGPDDQLTLTPQGGGGTDFSPVFEWVEEQQLRPKALVYLTDLYGSHYYKQPDYPVLWACWSECTDIPWGELIAVKE